MKIRNNIHLIFIIALLMTSFSSIKAEDINDCILKVGTSDGVGPMNMHGFYGRILGSVYLSDETNPDIFIQSDRWTPGFFLYKYKGRSSDGIPIFGERISVILPEEIKSTSYPGSIIQNDQKEIFLIWYSADELHKAQFNSITNAFTKIGSVAFPKMSFSPKSILVTFEDGMTKVLAEIPSSEFVAPPGNWRAEDFIPYTKSGIWRGEINKVGLYEIIFPGFLEGESSSVKRVSSTDSEVYMSYRSVSNIDLREEESDDLIVGSYMGVLYYYKKDKGSDICEKKVHVVDESGNALRHPGISATPIAYPNSEGKYCDIIATCEGGVYYYKFTGNLTESGKPIYTKPLEVLEENANLHGGSLPAPTIVDFDGDGILDIVAGNSQGFINFFKNVGTNAAPLFLPGEPVKANGKIIQIQPGYGESVQGPVESRWGYVGPNVIDWDGDGYLDILTNDSRGKHMIYKGVSNSGDYRFKKEAPLYCRDLELRGTWRCRPGVGLWNGKMSYITLDDEDEFHLYERIDDQNLADKGKLKLSDGSNIKGTYQFSGGTGRIRFEIVDWDGDGVKDLILGVCKWHSVPNPENGLPFKQPYEGIAAAGALFMRNVGTEANPKFEFPEPIAYKGKVIQMGGHEAGVCTGYLGEIKDNKPNLLIVNEQGRFFLLGHEEVNPTCDIAEDLPGFFVDKTQSSLSADYFTTSSIIKLANGNLVASYFNYTKTPKTIIQESEDKGLTWNKIAELDYGRNGNLFVVDNQLYLICSSNSDNSCVILKSEDGRNWTTPTTPSTGILQLSTATNTVEMTSTPIFEWNSVLYKSIQQIDSKGKRKVAFMSARKDANLLLRTSWTYSNYLPLDVSLEVTASTWQDLNVVKGTDNSILGLLSLKGSNGNSVAKINLSSDAKSATFSSSDGVIAMPGGGKKFALKYDPISQKYWAVTNTIQGNVGDISPDLVYNTLTLISSANLKNWTVEKQIYSESDSSANGFVGSDWIFDGNDIIGIASLSWKDCKGSVSHIERSNYVITFRVDNFR